MKTQKMKIGNLLLLVAVCISALIVVHTGYAQQIRWLRVTSLQSPINEIGAEFEGEFPAAATDILTWPAQYSINQTALRARFLWIGCLNFDDPVAGTVKNHKVVGSNRTETAPTMLFPVQIKLIGRSYHPVVVVDDQHASVLYSYDNLDEVDPNMKADRMVLVKLNTSIGVSVTKKVMAFDQSNHDNYYIYDYVFKNTGIINAAGDVKQQTLNGCYFYFCDRYAMSGVSCTGYGLGWGAWSSTWGNSQIHHTFGGDPTAPAFADPNSPLYQLRGFYNWYGPDKDRTQVTYAEDWGCPAQNEDGELASAKYAGKVILHADKSPQDASDDLFQPRTNTFISADINIFQRQDQYDEAVMKDRYDAMIDGYPVKQHDELVDDDYPINYVDPRRQTGGGVSGSTSFGPYTLAPGDSIHIVFAEGVSGISWEKGREVGGKWLQYFKKSGTPNLILPDGSSTTDHNLYKRKWCETGKDSILQTLRIALRNYNSGYQIPKGPPPPDEFKVTSGGDRIMLEWSSSADAAPHFGGYVVYRSVGTVLDRKTVYEKIFECSASNVVHNFDDVTAHRGFDYYYYVQSKDDGTQNDLHPGTPLYSSMFWTVTSVPATLQRPAGPVTPFPPDVNTTFWKLIASFKGPWKSGTNYNPNSHDVVSYLGSNYICKLLTSDTTTPNLDDTHWRLVTTQGDSVAFDKGPWVHGSSYADTTHDIVSYNGSSYICKAIIAHDSTSPDLDNTRWKLLTSKGDWISGSKYTANDVVGYFSSSFVTLYSIASGNGLDLVRVVPNPYDVRSRLFQFGETSQYDRIAFYGLPAICKLKIFTERGDLIWEKDHIRGTGDELWDSKTSSGQIIASGIYILYVEVAGRGSVCRKFVVIR
jgi:hypothetical protein